MVKVAEVCKPESYVASQETNWKMDMEEEMCALVENKTWDLVDSAKGIKPIGWKWVFKVKYNAYGSVNRCKAQLVAKGYTQTHNVDYGNTFVMVAKMMIVHVLLVVTTTKGLHLH